MSRQTADASASVAGPGYRQWPPALLRILIGWRLLRGYLKSSTGPLAGFFHWLAADAGVIRITDGINVWGLLLIGSALMLGLLTRAAAVSGMALLALYYFAYRPLFAPITRSVSEGSYLIVNKNLLELCALAVVVAFPAASFGLEGLLARRSRNAGRDSAADTPSANGLDGADFICVGMYDFQIADDVNIALEVLNGGLVRAPVVHVGRKKEDAEPAREVQTGVFELPMNLKRNHLSFSHTADHVGVSLQAAEDSLKEIACEMRTREFFHAR